MESLRAALKPCTEIETGSLPTRGGEVCLQYSRSNRPLDDGVAQHVQHHHLAILDPPVVSVVDHHNTIDDAGEPSAASSNKPNGLKPMISSPFGSRHQVRGITAHTRKYQKIILLRVVRQLPDKHIFEGVVI